MSVDCGSGKRKARFVKQREGRNEQYHGEYSKRATGSRVASRRPLLIPDTPALVILQRSLGSRVTWPPPDFLCTPADAGSVCVWVGGDRDVNSVSLFAPYS